MQEKELQGGTAGRSAAHRVRTPTEEKPFERRIRPWLLAIAVFAIGAGICWLARQQGLDFERKARDTRFRAASEALIGQLQSDTYSGFSVLRMLAAADDTGSAEDPTAFARLVARMDLSRFALPVRAIAAVDFGAKGGGLRYWQDPLIGDMSAPVALHEVARAALVEETTVSALAAEGGVSAVLAVRGGADRVYLMLVDPQRWIENRLAPRKGKLGLRIEAERIGSTGPRMLGESAGYNGLPGARASGFLTSGQQRWRFEVAGVKPPPTASSSIVLQAGLVASAGLAALVWFLATRLAEAELRAAKSGQARDASEHRMRSLFSACEDGIWEFDPNARTCALSMTAARQLGLPPGLGRYGARAILRRMHRADRRVLLGGLRVALRERQALDVECRVFDTEGSERWLRVRARVPASGPAVALVGTFVDISLQRSYAEGIGRQRSFLAGVLDALPTAVTIKDATHRVLVANKAFCDLTGHSAESVIGRRTRSITTDELGEKLEGLDVEALATGRRQEMSQWFDFADGRRRFVRIVRTPTVGPDGEPVIVASFLDLTLERDAMRRQQRAREFLLRLIDLMPHGIVVVDAGNRCAHVNPAFCGLAGQTHEQIIGRDVRSLGFDPAIAGLLAGVGRELIRNHGEQEFVWPDAQGRRRVFQLRLADCKDQEGLPVRLGVVEEVTRLVEAREAERKARRNMDSLYAGAPVGLVLLDRAGNILQANPAFRELVGHDEATLQQLETGGLVPEKWKKTAARKLAEVMELGRALPLDVALLHAAGHELPVRVASVRICSESDGLVWSIVEDISQRVAAEKALDTADKRWQFALTGTGDGVWDWNLQEQKVFYSSRWKQMLGYADDEIAESFHDWSARVHPDEIDRAMIEIERHMAGETEGFAFEARMRQSDGEWRWLLSRGVVVERLPDGRPLRMIGTHTDIAQLKQAQLDAQRRRDQLEAIRCLQEAFIRAPEGRAPFDAMLEALLRFTGSQFGFVGDVFAGEQGLTLRVPSVGGIGWNEFVRAHYTHRVAQGIELHGLEKIFGSGIVDGRPFTMNHSSGISMLAQLPPDHPPLSSFIGLPVHYGSDLIGLVGLANRDGGFDASLFEEIAPLLRSVGEIITAQRAEQARREAERELARHRDRLSELVLEQTADLIAARDAAEAANEAKSTFLANMSHELRTPLHAALSFARLGESRIGTVPEQRLGEFFGRIRESGERLLVLLDGLLDLAKLEAGAIVMDISPSDLRPLFGEIEAEFGALLTARDQRIVREIDPQLPCVACDVQRIGQVLRNLLANAIKFSPEGSAITLRAAPVVFPRDGRPGGGVEIRISDQGPGIPEAERESVFEKFVQSSLTRTGAGGTGLGLAISREIVVAHGGRIFAREAVGGGAEIVVRLLAIEHETVTE